MTKSEYPPMKEIKETSFKETSIGNYEVSKRKHITHLQPTPDEFEVFTTTVWSVPKRGKWATHASDYRGNWAPQIARNIILRYSQEGDTVLDQMVGGGTTLIECKLTGRNGIGVDINPDAIMITRDRLNFGDDSRLDEFAGEPQPRKRGRPRKDDPERAGQPEVLDAPSLLLRAGQHSEGQKARIAALPPYRDGLGAEHPTPRTSQRTYLGDARNLDAIADESVDLIATHPPYANIIEYGEKQVEGDISNVKGVKDFCREMYLVAKECFRVLRPGKYCAILIGDTRRKKHFVPITPRVMDEFLRAGFILRESIIKRQWNCMTTGFWTKRSIQDNFLLIMHEHLYVFRKPTSNENLKEYSESMIDAK